MPVHAVTVLGRDRPGIIAETTAHLARLGLNLEDSSMTRLRGHFAMTLVCSGGPDGPNRTDVEQALAPLTETLDVVVVDVTDVDDDHDDRDDRGDDRGDDRAAPTSGTAWVLTVHGGDRPGIVSAVAAEVASAGGNVTDLTTRLSGELYVLVAEIDLPPHLGPDAAGDLEAAVHAVARGLGVEAALRPAESDEL